MVYFFKEIKARLHGREIWVRTCHKNGPDLTTFVEKQSNQNGAIGAYGPVLIWCFVNVWGILGDFWEEILFLRGLVKFTEIKSMSDFMLF